MGVDVTNLELLIIGVVNFVTAIFAGMSGGGGGFIGTPLLIFIGLSPAQAVATGKLGGLAVSLGSLGGLRGVSRKSTKRRLAIVLALALAVGLVAPMVITRLDNEVYRRTLGFILLLMIPILIFKKVGHVEQAVTPHKKILGYGLLVVAFGLQAVFAGGLGTLVIVVFMAFLGMPALEANLMKRYSQVLLNSVLVIGLLSSGLLIWSVAIVSMITATIGGFIGGKIATKKGNSFVITVFLILMFISSLELIFG